MTFDRTLVGRGVRHGGRRQGRSVPGYKLPQDGQLSHKGEKACRCWLWTSGNASVAAGDVQQLTAEVEDADAK